MYTHGQSDWYLEQGLVVVGGRGNASVITLPFLPEGTLPCSAYIRTNSLGGVAPVAPRTPKPPSFWVLSLSSGLSFPRGLNCAFRRASKRQEQCTMQQVTPLKSARPPLASQSCSRHGGFARRKLISPVRPRRRCVPRFPSVWWSASGSHSANKRLEGVRLWGALNALSNAKCTIHRET